MNKTFKEEFRDQKWHFLSCFGFTILAAVPLIGPILVVVLWACTREYYQHKVEADDFFENIHALNFWNLDLKVSYSGIIVATLVSATVWSYILL